MPWCDHSPALVGAYINNVLKPYGRRIGPDPASIDAAMLGGILANNASGMCCGVVENAVSHPPLVDPGTAQRPGAGYSSPGRGHSSSGTGS